MKVRLAREFEAERWLGEGHPLPEGAHLCLPEIHWAAGRKHVYFTYADLSAHSWMGVAELDQPAAGGPMTEGIQCVTLDGRIYHRELLPFVFWSVKSEAQITRDHRAVYFDPRSADEAMQRLFADYVWKHSWAETSGKLPARAEYRVVDGGYGRGFRPYYMKPGDWLLHETDREGKAAPRVVGEEEFTRMCAGVTG